MRRLLKSMDFFYGIDTINKTLFVFSSAFDRGYKPGCWDLEFDLSSIGEALCMLWGHIYKAQRLKPFAYDPFVTRSIKQPDDGLSMVEACEASGRIAAIMALSPELIEYIKTIGDIWNAKALSNKASSQA